MSLIPPEEIKVLRWESSDGSAGVGIYKVDDRGCPGTTLMQVEMTASEMVELAHDLLATARDRDPGLAYSAVATRPTDGPTPSCLVDDLNGAAQKVEAYEDLIASLWGDIDGYYGPRYRDDGLLDEVLASVKARGGRS